VTHERPAVELTDYVVVALLVILLALAARCWIVGAAERRERECERLACPDGQVAALVDRECRCLERTQP
jgi:hypothetical protein